MLPDFYERNEMKEKTRRPVSELGMAAYVKMHGFRCLGRKGRTFYFETEEGDESIDQLLIEYLNSPMHDFDSAIMSLKKMPSEFVQE